MEKKLGRSYKLDLKLTIEIYKEMPKNSWNNE